MKNSFLLVSFLFYSFGIVIAQEREHEFGQVDLGELTMKECSFEKNANAVNLIKTAKISFETSVRASIPFVYSEYRVRIKIFNEQGFSAANIKIPVVNENNLSKITDIEAFIYNLDSTGKIVKEKLEKKEISKEKIKTKNSIKYISFTFPRLQKGSVIEYRYFKKDKNSFKVEPWFFQDVIPTSLSKVTLAIPTYIRMNYHFITSVPIERDSGYKKHGGGFYDEQIVSFTARKIPSFRIEPFMSSLADNIQRVEFALRLGNNFENLFDNSDLRWKYYNTHLLNASYFGLQFDKHLDSTDQFIDSLKKLNNVETKVAAVFAYVKKNIEWNKELTFYSDSIEECWKTKLGSSAEMNISLLNLLRKSNVKCFPILVSTRENGMADEAFTSLSQFNSVDVIVADSNYLFILDCTQNGLSYKIPPQNVLNSKAYLVDPYLNKWIYLTDARILKKNEANIMAVLDSAGNVTGEARLKFIGFAKLGALEEQKKNKENTTREETDLSGNSEDILIDSVITEGNNENCDTLIQKIHFHFKLTNTGNSFFLNPSLFSYLIKNPFTDSSRQYDIDFGCTQSHFISMHLKVADNFSLEGFPKAMSIRMPDSSILFRREIFQQNNELLIRTVFTLHNSYFYKENYGAIKSFFDRVYAIINDLVLLKKND